MLEPRDSDERATSVWAPQRFSACAGAAFRRPGKYRTMLWVVPLLICGVSVCACCALYMFRRSGARELCVREAEKLMVDMRGRGVVDSGVFPLGPLDSWGNELMALYVEKANYRVARVSSAAGDGKHGTNDDIVGSAIYHDWPAMLGDGVEAASVRVGKGFTRGALGEIKKGRPGA